MPILVSFCLKTFIHSTLNMCTRVLSLYVCINLFPTLYVQVYCPNIIDSPIFYSKMLQLCESHGFLLYSGHHLNVHFVKILLFLDWKHWSRNIQILQFCLFQSKILYENKWNALIRDSNCSPFGLRMSLKVSLPTSFGHLWVEIVIS